jgi:dTDP-4-amino-4,6-dideoxy-D-galactose acyltransferase
LKEVLALATRTRLKPYRHHAHFGEEALGQLLVARVNRALAGSPHTCVARLDGRLTGAVAAEHLAWDSAQFDFPAGRIGLLLGTGDYANDLASYRVLLRTAEKRLYEQHGVRHITLRVDAADLAAVHAAGRLGYEQVDGIIVLARSCALAPGRDVTAGNTRVRLAGPGDAEALAAIARRAYSVTRFHADPHIPHVAADELHAVWLRNSCAGTAADAVVVAEDQHGPVGYITCTVAKDTVKVLGGGIGTIVLVATDHRARGRGVATAMTEFAMRWFSERGCSAVEVGTQLANIAASRLYESCGFRVAGSYLTLRRWLH